VFSVRYELYSGIDYYVDKFPASIVETWDGSRASLPEVCGGKGGRGDGLVSE
jgi:hypothetical protein